MSRTGLEGRFADRFVKRAETPAARILDVNEVRALADNYKLALSVIESQQATINDLFDHVWESVESIDKFQQLSGKRQVQNLMLPTPEIRSSSGLKLGYIKMGISFFGFGMQHFMEELMSSETELSTLEKVVSQVAEYNAPVTVIGDLVDINPDDFSTDSPISQTKTDIGIDLDDDTSEDEDDDKPAPPISPPITPGKVGQLKKGQSTKTAAKPVVQRKK